MAMHVCRSAVKVSLAAKSPFAKKSPIGARFCHSVAGGIPPDFYGGAFGGTAFVAWLFYRFDFRGWRTWVEASMEEVRRLDFEYAKDGLEALEREIDAMKAKQHERARNDNVPKEIPCSKLTG